MAVIPKIILLTAPDQEPAATRLGVTTSVADGFRESWLLSYLYEAPTRPLVVDASTVEMTTLSVLSMPTSMQRWTAPPVRHRRRRPTRVEAGVIRSAQDEDFDLSLVRDDLLR